MTFSEIMQIVLWGINEYSIWAYVITALVLTHITIASVTIFLHRHQAHRALDLHPSISHFFRFWLWMTTGMVTREWVAIHRKHHAKCESEDDPHSPQIHGLASVLWGGVLHYIKEKNNKETITRYSYGVPDDAIERKLYSKYPALGVTLMALINIACFGVVAGMSIWVVQMVWIPFWAAGVINGIGHYWGYRNFHPQDESRNIVPFGILIGGEELHNNHHSFPTSARLSNLAFEFDIGWLYIKILEKCGLAKIKRVAPKLLSTESQATCDLDTLQSVITNRLEVLVRFTKSVKATCEHELKAFQESRASQLSAKSLNNWLQGMHFRVDDGDEKAIRELIDDSAVMAKVSELRSNLISLWEDHTVAPEELVERLRQWCADAEKSGIASLREFAIELRGCRSTPAVLA